MSSPRLLTDKELTALWRIWPNTLAEWRKEGVVACDGCDNDAEHEHWYRYETIDAIHKKNASIKDAVVPTVAEMLEHATAAGGPALLTPAEAATQLGVTRPTLRAETKSRGVLLAVRGKSGGRGQWLYPAITFEAYAKSRQNDDIPIDLIGKYIGVSENRGKLIVRQHPSLFAVTRRRASYTRKYVTRQSLAAYIESKLARGADGKLYVSGEAWLEMRESSNFNELLHKSDVKKRYSTHARKIEQNIADGTFLCIYTPGGEARIPLHTVEAWHLSRKVQPHYPRATARQLAEALYITTEEAAKLITNPEFCSRNHPGIEKANCPTVFCVRYYVRQNRTSRRMGVTKWIQRAAEAPKSAVKYNLHEKPQDFLTSELYVGLKNGTVHGLRLPDGIHVVVPLAEVYALKRRLRRIDNQLSPDYHRSYLDFVE